MKRAQGLPAALLLVGLWALPACAGAQGADATPEGAADALRTGRYDDAVAGFTALAAGPEAAAGAHRGLVEALMATGLHAEAEEAARRGEGAVGPALSTTLGEVLLARGRLDEAAEAFRRGSAPGAPDRLTALYHLAALQHRRGDRPGALDTFDGFIDLYNAGAARTSRDLTAVALAVQALGVRDPVLFRDALRAFDEAIDADPSDPEPRLRVGELFLAKYNGGDARASFEEVLAVNPRNARALLGRARALDFTREGGALPAVQAALEVNPSLVEARVFLGQLQLGLEEAGEAVVEAERALEVNPASLEAWALMAAARRVQGDQAGFQEARRRALELDPGYSGLYVALAEAAVNTRRYADAVEFAREGLELDSLDWTARGLLGINQLRMGAMAEGRANLDRAFAGDPYNVWFKNTLDLLDSLERYEEISRGPFTLVLRDDEAELLAPLVGEVAEEAWAALTRRYGVSPDVPVRVELYPNSADFSVRTVGLTGIGALGVAFGRVLAMDSPSARPPGELNWASVLWHELAHVVHLALSRSAMPRWFGEGLAVYEQRQARSGWGQGVSPGLLRAWDQGLLPPVSELNRAFVRPPYPEAIGHAYVLSSLVCEYIAETRGEGALVEMLRGYGRGLSNDEVVRAVLEVEPAELDRAFDDWLRARYAGPMAAVRSEAEGSGGLPAAPGAPAIGLPSPEETGRAAAERPGDFRAQLLHATVLFQAERYRDALPVLERARALFPEYGGSDGPDWMLARIHVLDGDTRAARAALERLLALNESHLEGARSLARILREAGEFEEAEEALRRGVEIHPFDPALHRERAEVNEARGAWSEVVSSRRAIVALNPVDRAAAHYELARALAEAGDTAMARREVLRALEVAPAYEAAQELLLRLRGTGEEER
jgi:cellulose synthase operon protein C